MKKRTKQLAPARVEVNTRMPVETAQLLTDASEKTGQTKTQLIVDAIHWYCGIISKEDKNISLRRAGVLSALGGSALEPGMQQNVNALSELADVLRKHGIK